MYQVLARTWRPQNFSELVGQEQVARTLSNAIEAGRLAHAYIFAGLRGTGKTTVARILAKCLNCQEGPTANPCGRCDACLEIAESRAIDVLELDAASRTGVGDIRELQEVISYAPVRDRYKVLIIDEAHMLSKQAFNALLKTLEEPPPNVVFIQATTELQKILPTILSRCQVFEFRRVTASEMVTHLQRICSAEKIDISRSALERIARAGEGSVRDSLSVLERVVAFCGQTVADEDVLRVLGAVDSRVLQEMVAGLATRNAGAMIAVLDRLVDEGHDLIHFWGQFIATLRDLMLILTLPDRRDLLSRPPEEADALQVAATGLTRDDLSRAFQIVAELEFGLKSSSQPRFLFEATLIRLAALGAVQPIEALLRSFGPAAGHPTQHATAAQPPKKKLENTAAPPAAPRPRAGGLDGLAEAVGRTRPMLGAMLGQASSIERRADRVVIGLPAGRDMLKRQMEQRDSLALIAEQAQAILGVPVTVAIEVVPAAAGPGSVAAGSTPSRPPLEPPAPADAAGASPKPAPAPAAAPKAVEAGSKKQRRAVVPSERQALLDTARGEPGVKKLLDTFGAQVVDVHPDDGSKETEEPR